MCWSEDSTARPEFSELVVMLDTVARGLVKEHPDYVNISNGTKPNGSAVQQL